MKNYTERRLKEFDEKYIKDKERPRFCSCVEGDLYDVWKDDIAELKSFLTTSIAQALAEERKRVRGLIKSRKPDERKVSTYKTVEARTWYEKNLVIEALDDLLDLLDKPLKDNKDI